MNVFSGENIHFWVYPIYFSIWQLNQVYSPTYLNQIVVVR